MSHLAFLLVHGFSGCDQDLHPLADKLKDVWGQESVYLMQLPGHIGNEPISGFDQDRLLSAISRTLEQLRQRVGTLIVLGHSTGGNLLLAALERTTIVPDLLILSATPFRIDLAYLERWQKHSHGQKDLSLTTVSGLIRMINIAAERGSMPACPALLLQGENDSLVIPQEAQRWQKNIAGDVRLISLPASGHQLFCDSGWEAATGALIKGVSEILKSIDVNSQRFAQKLLAAEPEATQFIAANPSQLHHLALSPSGRRFQGTVAERPEIVPWGPVFANIEITTFCNFSCRHCARTVLRPTEEMMSLELFESLLDRLPSAYRVTLVGLGEPLLHPQLTEFIALAKARGRRVGMVTNTQLLSAKNSAKILASGLDSIAFSLDAVSQELLTELRSGSDLANIETNIRAFCNQADKLPRPISRAVFSAVSAASLNGLEALIERVSKLGVQVLMLSDLNFSYNQEESLSSHVSEESERQIRRAIVQGFSLGLPVLGVRALEDFGLAHIFREALLLPVQQLYRRSKQHRHCSSPWQTLSINVAGEICICDCQPERNLGNLQQHSLASLWNGSGMREQRRLMLSEQPPPECLICPRF